MTVEGNTLNRSQIFPPLFCSNGLSAILSRWLQFRSHIHTLTNSLSLYCTQQRTQSILTFLHEAFSFCQVTQAGKKLKTNEIGLCWKSLPIFRLSQRCFSSLISVPHNRLLDADTRTVVTGTRPPWRVTAVAYITTFSWHCGRVALYIALNRLFISFMSVFVIIKI